MRKILCLLVWLPVSLTGCAGEPPSEHVSTLVEEARAGNHGMPPPGHRPADGDPSAFHRQLTGLWHATTFQQAPGGASAWVDLYWIIGRNHAWHVVRLFADAELQTPLLRWDLIRSYRLEQPSLIFPDAYDLEWTDVGSWLTPYVSHPALLASIGVDDCSLEVGTRTDTSDNCGAPFFPFRDCALMDFAQLADDRLTFGDPQSTDRCVERANRYERWTFERAAFTPQVLQALLGAWS